MKVLVDNCQKKEEEKKVLMSFHFCDRLPIFLKFFFCSRRGSPVLCALLQPSWQLLQTFDKVSKKKSKLEEEENIQNFLFLWFVLEKAGKRD